VKGGILVTIEQLPLSKQVEIVFREIQDELFQLSSGIIFMQIRNNVIGNSVPDTIRWRAKVGFFK